MSETTCRICGCSRSNPTFVVREMMFGTQEEFEYFRCVECGCIQICFIPDEMSRYYPKDYYSLAGNAGSICDEPTLKRLARKAMVRNALFGRGYKIARLASNCAELPGSLHRYGSWLKKSGIRHFKAKFLDVGCGESSWWLRELKDMGFSNLEGLDPYIEKNGSVDGIRIKKGELSDVKEKYDLVTLHHSLEHMPDQLEAMGYVYESVEKGGACIVRIPIASSRVCEEYGVDWVEWDAPRHFYLHSVESIKELGERVGFTLEEIIWDSTGFVYWGSEQYRRGISLMSPNSFHVNKGNSDFTYKEIAQFENRAELDNAEGVAGRGCFIFRKYT